MERLLRFLMGRMFEPVLWILGILSTLLFFVVVLLAPSDPVRQGAAPARATTASLWPAADVAR